VCNKCGYCRNLTEKITQVYTKGGTEFEALAPLESFAVKI